MKGVRPAIVGIRERKRGYGDSADNFERTKVMVAAAYEVWCNDRGIRNHSWAETIHNDAKIARVKK